VVQQCTGIVVGLNIQFEITYSTTVVEYNTTMALVDLMERCNFVSAGTETEATGHHFIGKLSKGSPFITGGSRPTEVLSKETYLVIILLASIHQEVPKL
jgi:hypothetical protein